MAVEPDVRRLTAWRDWRASEPARAARARRARAAASELARLSGRRASARAPSGRRFPVDPPSSSVPGTAGTLWPAPSPIRDWSRIHHPESSRCTRQLPRVHEAPSGISQVRRKSTCPQENCSPSRPRRSASVALRAAACSSSSAGEVRAAEVRQPTNASHGWPRLRRHERPGRRAQKEGTLNVITLPAIARANYGTIMKDFTAKYGIKINDAQSRRLQPGRDQRDASSSRARTGHRTCSTWAPRSRSRRDQQGLLAPYKVATWDSHPG